MVSFAPLCPDFVVELRSPSDRLVDLRAKLSDYLANGARLGWFIEPYARMVETYRPGHDVEALSNPETVAADDVLPGFVLKLASIFEA
jgi:Uma2 family endonuclease